MIIFDNFYKVIFCMAEDVKASSNVDTVYDALVNNTFEGLNSLELVCNVDIGEDNEAEIYDLKVVKEKSGHGFSFKIKKNEYRYVSDKISCDQLMRKTISISNPGKAIAWLNANSVCYYGGIGKRKLTPNVKKCKTASECAENYVVNQLKDITGSLQSIANSDGFVVDYGLGENDNDVGPINIDCPYVSLYSRSDVTTASFKASDTFKELESLDGASKVQFIEDEQGIYDTQPVSCMYVKFCDLQDLIDEALKTTLTCPECGYTDAQNNFPGGDDGSVECPECHEIFSHAKSEAIASIKNRFAFVGILDQEGVILEETEISPITQGTKDKTSDYELGNLYGTDGGNYTIANNNHGTLTIVDVNDNMYDVDESDFVLLNPFKMGTSGCTK